MSNLGDVTALSTPSALYADSTVSATSSMSLSGMSVSAMSMTGVSFLGHGTDPFADDEPDWHERALCAQTDPEAFFPEKGGSTREAKKICTGCEVRSECLSYALANDERFGIWGGLSERERRRLKRSAG